MSRKKPETIHIKRIDEVPYTEAIKGVITKIGNGGHVMMPKEYIGFEALTLVLHPGMIPKVNKHKIVTKDGVQYYEATVHPGFSEVKMYLKKVDVDKNKVLYSIN